MTDNHEAHGQFPLAFGTRLRQLREASGLGLRPFGELVKYSHQRLSQIERGATPNLPFAEAADEILMANGELIALAKTELSNERMWPRPAQLPPGRALLVGREAELTRILQALTGSDLTPETPATVVIEGPPGIGKTSLAIAAAQKLAKSHPDGTLFRDLGGVSPRGPAAHSSVVLGEFLRALGVQPETIPARLMERSALFRSLVHNRRMVIVLDDASSEAQIAELVPNAPGCTVIVTSRRRLTTASGWTAGGLVVLGPLVEDDAVKLLGTIVGGERVKAEPDEAARLVRLCGCAPLPVCMIGDRFALRPHHSLAELNADLGEVDLLGRSEDRSESESVRVIFSWSYLALAPEQQRAFRLLSVHPSDEISTASAAALFDMPPRSARAVLEGLALAHLLAETGRDRWQFHNLLRAYAKERLASEDRDADRVAAVSRLVGWYTHCAIDAGRAINPWHTGRVELLPLPGSVRPIIFDGRTSALEWYDLECWAFGPICRLALEYGLFEWCWQLSVGLQGWLLLRWPTEVWARPTGLQSRPRRYLPIRVVKRWCWPMWHPCTASDGSTARRKAVCAARSACMKVKRMILEWRGRSLGWVTWIFIVSERLRDSRISSEH